jgi:hypothetical protein
MTVVAVLGDGATTSTVALAVGWPTADQVVVVETDRRGGSLAAWLDVPLSPSLSTVVATLHGAGGGRDASTPWSTIEPLVRRAPSGIRFVPAPFRAREAGRAILEAERHLVPLLAQRDDVVALADCGRPAVVDEVSGVLDHAAAVVVCHRQETASAAAASVRVERLAEQLASLRDRGARVVLAVVGEEPFAGDEIARFVGPEVSWRPLAADPLAAAVLAGRRGVSPRRLARLPLLRTAAQIADDVRTAATTTTTATTATTASAGWPR